MCFGHNQRRCRADAWRFKPFPCGNFGAWDERGWIVDEINNPVGGTLHTIFFFYIVYYELYGSCKFVHAMPNMAVLFTSNKPSPKRLPGDSQLDKFHRL